MISQTRRAGWHFALAASLCFAGVPVLAQSGNIWTPTTAPMNPNRDSHSAISLNGDVYLFGGRTDPTAGYTTHSSDLFTSGFSALSSMGYSRSFFPAVPL